MGTLEHGWRRCRRLPLRWQAAIATTVVLVVALLGSTGEEDTGAVATPASAEQVTSTTAAAPATTTALPAATATTAAEPDDGVAVVARNVDGDTLHLRDGRKLRLIGVDTPETQHPSKPVECFGREASAYTAERFPPGTKVRVVYDVERHDRYGRDLVYLHRVSDDLFLNLQLVRDGFAQASTHPPNVAHTDQFVAAQREARDADRGLWGPACSTPAAPVAVAAPATTTTAAPAGGTTHFENCDAAREAGAAPVHRGDPGYGSHLDRDDDGIGCE